MEANQLQKPVMMGTESTVMVAVHSAMWRLDLSVSVAALLQIPGVA